VVIVLWIKQESRVCLGSALIDSFHCHGHCAMNPRVRWFTTHVLAWGRRITRPIVLVVKNIIGGTSIVSIRAGSTLLGCKRYLLPGWHVQ
jgi:hypothetical protein